MEADHTAVIWEDGNMRRIAYVGLAILLLAGAAFAVSQSRAARADDTKAIPVKAVGRNGSVPEGDACSIARVDGLYPGFPQQVILEDAAGTIVAKHSLLDGKGNADGKCEVLFTMPFPDSPFVTVYVDDARVTTLEPSDLPFADNAPLNLWVPN